VIPVSGEGKFRILVAGEDGSSEDFSVLNAQGRRMIQAKYSSEDGRLDLSGCPGGLYFLQFSEGGIRRSLAFLKN
jgi:hypothetical protein